MRVTDPREYLRRNAAHEPPLPLRQRAIEIGLTLIAGPIVFAHVMATCPGARVRAAIEVARAVADRLRFDLDGRCDEHFREEDDPFFSLRNVST